MKKWLSRKLLVYIGGIAVILLVKAGVPEEMAGDLMDSIVNITMVYLGAQGLADAAGAIKGGQ